MVANNSIIAHVSFFCLLIIESSYAFTSLAATTSITRKDVGLHMNLMDDVENALLSSITEGKDRTESKDLVDRLFSLSALGLRRRESDINIASLFPSDLFDTSNRFGRNVVDDIVLYPIVGFKWVATDEEHISDLKLQVIPFSTTQVSMPVMLAQQRDEEIYGWFQPVCNKDMEDESYA